MPDELVFTVAGAGATPAEAVDLAEAGLREREHLQEWVIGHPEIIGSDLLIITTEFDRWESRSGAERDRLDVLALDSSGHLVVTELKRDRAPDTVEMQSIKYAAMASRFDKELLGDAYVDFQRKTHGENLTQTEAIEKLEAHTEYQLDAETLRSPRIVIIAGSFPASTSATVVWLNEMGLDITLIRVQAYRTQEGIVVTVSQHYPPPDVEEFTVAPTRSARRARPSADYPEVEWSQEDFDKAAKILTNATAIAALDLCSERPEEWVPFEEIIELSGRDPAQARGDTGGFTGTVRAHFKRSNWPYESQWAAGGKYQSYYRMDPQSAEMWKRARQRIDDSQPQSPSKE
jgi:hypothetical protein